MSDIERDWHATLEYLGQKAKDNLMTDKFLAPVVFVASDSAEVIPVAVQNEQMLKDDAFASALAVLLQEHRAIAYFVICDVFQHTECEEGAHDKKDAILVYGRHADGRARVRTLQYSKTEDAIVFAKDWFESHGDIVAGGVFADLFQQT